MGNVVGKDELPPQSKVMNSYFSFGIDADISLAFNEARKKKPENFLSTLDNKWFYFKEAAKDLWETKWKHLSDVVTLECDGKNMTLKNHSVHAVLFLNIPFYGGGTLPWATSCNKKQATDDGLIEVIGLTTYQLDLLQFGGQGTCIAQCKKATVVTSQPIPMQVDGDAIMINPSIIELSQRDIDRASMLAKKNS